MEYTYTQKMFVKEDDLQRLLSVVNIINSNEHGDVSNKCN